MGESETTWTIILFNICIRKAAIWMSYSFLAQFGAEICPCKVKLGILAILPYTLVYICKYIYIYIYMLFI